MGDKLIEVCTFFFVMTVVAYVMIAYRQFSYLQPSTYRLTVLSTRTALLLPLCAFFIYISAIYPSSYVMLMVLITAIEGYCLYAFFALLTANLGGPNAVVELVSKSQRALLCYFCLPNEPAQFFRLTVWATFHLIATRTVLSVIAAICFYADTKAGKQAYVVYNFLSAIVLVYGMVCLVNLYENVYEHCINLFGVLKLALLKISVGAIVLQGLIENVLFSNGSITYTDDDTYSAEQKSMRAYCGLVLLEFALLSVVFYYAFGDHKITPSSAPPAVRAFMTDRRSPHRVSTSGVRAVETLVYSFSTFMKDVFAVQDILQISYFHVEETEISLSEPLNSGDIDSGRAGHPVPKGAGSSGGASRWILGTIAGYVSPTASPQQQQRAAPWSAQSRAARAAYSSLPKSGEDAGDWDEEFSLPEEAAATGAGAAAGASPQRDFAGTSAAPLSPLVNMAQIYGSPPGSSPAGRMQYQDTPSMARHGSAPGSSAGSGIAGGAMRTPERGAQQQPGAAHSPLVDYAQVYSGEDDVDEHESV